MPEVHSKYSPSASARWLACSGSLHDVTEHDLEVQTNHQDLTAADRGTLGHKIVELILSGEWETAKGLYKDPLMDEDLSDDITFCVDWVKDNLPSDYAADGISGLEVRLESGLIDGFGGTMDVLRIIDNFARIVDFKFGRELVAAENNPQLLCYLLLVYEAYPDVERFQATVLQGGEEKTVQVHRIHLDAFFQAILKASLETYYEAGDHCQYCPLRYRCGTAAEFVFAETELGTELDVAEPYPTPERVEAVVRAAKAGKLAKNLYDLAAKVLKDWDKEGTHLGDEAKVTQSKRRKWNDFAEETLLEELGEAAYDKELRSPAQLQKATDLDAEAFNDRYGGLIDSTPTKTLRLGKLPPEFG